MSEASNSKILAECLEYVNEYYKNDHAAISNQNMFKEKQQNKILRVGYICHFLHNSVAKSIVLPFIKAHDRNKVEVYCYYDWDASEEREDMKRIAHHWRNTQNLNDDEFFNLIRDDDIDVLVEMNGHTAINRYSVCMRRAAPIQISFYNWAATSGIPNMDYNIIDNKVLDVSEDKYFTETIYRLPNAYGIANFDDTFPEVSPSPHLKNGYITFGSFGAAHKANENVVKLWCDVLHRVPNSKFFMKAGALSADFYKDNFYRYFHNNGIGKDRLIFEGWSPHHEMLCKYANVDIALDTFPYCGSTTTLEATWQGVPVITYSGNRLSTKSGTSMLTNLHLTEHIARTKEEVVEIASKLANNSERLINLRLNLRDKFKNSVLYDAKLFASDLEDAYYFMWKEWWAKKKSS
jgi:predicted O-linked N-acetylglucosamine transferase (SPINDLY family)